MSNAVKYNEFVEKSVLWSSFILCPQAFNIRGNCYHKIEYNAVLQFQPAEGGHCEDFDSRFTSLGDCFSATTLSTFVEYLIISESCFRFVNLKCPTVNVCTNCFFSCGV